MDSDEDWAGEEAEDYGSDVYSDENDDGSLAIIEESDGEKEKPSESYKALTEEEIRQLQEDAIARVSTSLSISRVGAALLLGQYQWRVDESEDAWFADEDGVRKSIGLLENPVVQVPGSMEEEITCRICFDKFPFEDFAAAACGHLFCKVCFNTYIRIAVEDGSGCLRLKCPEPSCVSAVGQDMVDSLASDEVKSKYDHYFLRSYIENNKKMKWCPAPGCDNAVKFDIGSEVYDVYCLCLNGFCWNCGEDAHRPVDCETVSKWVTKNSAESENVTWLLANSKPCPKCKYPIEKNHGCMHMTCRPPCKFEFCWLCLGAWSEHGERTGGFYACNKYEEAKLSGKLNEAEEKQRMAKNHIEKYTHYYERWQSNSKSRDKAILELKNMQDVRIKELSDFQAIPETQLTFVIDAWLQIVECRRVLKWTYAYGYYLPSDEKTKKRFFEYLQGEAESALERLHKCAEEDLNKHFKDDDCSQFPYVRHHTCAAEDPNKQLEADSSLSNFADYRVKLVTLTVATRSFFDNLVRALENGLSDVADKEVCASAEKSRKKSSAKEDGEGKYREQRLHFIEEEGVRRWSCPSCYCMNLESLTTCANCHLNISQDSDGD